MEKIKYILFDAANTLIHKPVLWEKIEGVLKEHEYTVERKQLKYAHKIVSEIINFPDRTTEAFYAQFNSKLLFSLGILPTQKLLTDLFKACTYLPWSAFEDSLSLKDLKTELGVISNFNISLEKILKDLLPVNFSHIIASENYDVRKPSMEFYQLGIQKTGCQPSEILYIGDSLELDIYPAKALGIHTCLIDREGHFPFYENRISSFDDIEDYMKHIQHD